MCGKIKLKVVVVVYINVNKLNLTRNCAINEIRE